MRHHGEHGGANVTGREEWNLVDVFENQIKPLSPKPPTIELGQSKMRIVPRSPPENPDAPVILFRRGSGERLGKPGHLVAVLDRPAQDFHEVELGAPRFRMLGIPPIEREQPHPIRTPERGESALSFRPRAQMTK